VCKEYFQFLVSYILCLLIASWLYKWHADCILTFLYWNWIWQEKAPYEAKAAIKKSDYGKLMTAYSKKQVNLLNVAFFRIKRTCLFFSQSHDYIMPLPGNGWWWCWRRRRLQTFSQVQIWSRWPRWQWRECRGNLLSASDISHYQIC